MKKQYKIWLPIIDEWCKKTKFKEITFRRRKIYNSFNVYVNNIDSLDKCDIEEGIINKIIQKTYLKDAISAIFKYEKGYLIGLINTYDNNSFPLNLSFKIDKKIIKNNYTLDFPSFYMKTNNNFKFNYSLKNGIVTEEEKIAIKKIETLLFNKCKSFFKEHKGAVVHVDKGHYRHYRNSFISSYSDNFSIDIIFRTTIKKNIKIKLTA